jgi:hypothetical protein
MLHCQNTINCKSITNMFQPNPVETTNAPELVIAWAHFVYFQAVVKAAKLHYCYTQV